MLGPDETVKAIEAAFADGVYSPGTWEFEEHSPDVVLSWTSVRHRTPSGRAGQLSDGRLFWLMSGRDGLIWRCRVFRTRAATLEALERHGPGLGL